MEQFENNENKNSAPGGMESQGFNPSYTPLDGFSRREEQPYQQPTQNAQSFQPSPEAAAANKESAPAPSSYDSQPAPESRPVSQPQPAPTEEPAYNAAERPQYQPCPPPKAPAPGMAPPPRAEEQSFAYNQNSGEYRYVPPYARDNPYAGLRPPVPNAPVMTEKKKTKSTKSFSAGAIALIVCACVLLSFGSGMLGAMFAGGGRAASGSDDPLVIYKNNKDQDGNTDTELAEGSLEGICAKVSDSVVEISTEYNTPYGNYQYVTEGAGSGVIISDNGYIITNNHVVTNTKDGSVADGVTVRLTDGSEYKAEVIGHDPDTDIAIIKIEAEGLSAATVGDSDTLKVGERVIAVGNPLGELGGTITSGIVSATNREISVDNNRMTLIQVDAAINPGNSGGGLFNMNGELIGVVNAKSTGVDIEGLGFAIPVNEAIDVANELRSNGYVSGRTYIGISLTDVTDSFTAYYYFRSESTGVYISQVQEGYNDSVLKYGDRITAIDGNEVTSSQDVKDAVQEHSVGEKMIFTLSREGKIIEAEVTCYEYVPTGVSFEER